MPTTATRGYRYPASTDPPNVPLDLQRLAEDVDADVARLRHFDGDELSGTWSGQTPRRRYLNGSYNTDGNGDTIILAGAVFAGGGILTASLSGTSTFDITCAFRIVSGNLVARLWDSGVLKTSVGVALTGFVDYWIPEG